MARLEIICAQMPVSRREQERAEAEELKAWVTLAGRVVRRSGWHPAQLGLSGHGHWSEEALQEFVFGYFSHSDQENPSDARLRAYQEQVALLRQGADPKTVNLSAQLSKSFFHYAMKLRGKRSPYFKAFRDLAVAAMGGQSATFGHDESRVSDEMLRAAFDHCGDLPRAQTIMEPNERAGPLTGLTAPVLSAWIKTRLAMHLTSRLSATLLAAELANRFGMQDVSVIMDDRPAQHQTSVELVRSRVLVNVLDVLTHSRRDMATLASVAEVDALKDVARSIEALDDTEKKVLTTLELSLTNATPLVYGKYTRRGRDKLRDARISLENKLRALLGGEGDTPPTRRTG